MKPERSEVAAAVEAARGALQTARRTKIIKRAPIVEQQDLFRVPDLVVCPTHEPCGAQALGELNEATLEIKCATVPTFERCSCAGLHQAYQKEKARASRWCGACGGTGWKRREKAPGCGARFGVCSACGLRFETEKGCAFHGKRPDKNS